jgi:hypothetical protein
LGKYLDHDDHRRGDEASRRVPRGR